LNPLILSGSTLLFIQGVITGDMNFPLPVNDFLYNLSDASIALVEIITAPFSDKTGLKG
jgi:hypothetical protein